MVLGLSSDMIDGIGIAVSGETGSLNPAITLLGNGYVCFSTATGKDD